LISILLVMVSLYIRLRMKESPIFHQLKQDGKCSSQPLREAFVDKGNLKLVLIALFGACAGQGAVALTVNVYTLYYLPTILKIDPRTTQMIIATALVLQIPALIFFGWVSDRAGRKKLMMMGCLLAVIFFYPIFRAMNYAARTNVVAVQSTKDSVTGEYKLTPVSPTEDLASLERYRGELIAPTPQATNPNVALLILLVLCLMICQAMIYGPIAAYLVEVFPAKIRYTSLSLPYHIGNGIFGGLVPSIGLISCAWTGNIYAGFIYPSVIAAITFVVGTTMLPETRHRKIWDEVKQ